MRTITVKNNLRSFEMNIFSFSEMCRNSGIPQSVIVKTIKNKKSVDIKDIIGG